MIWLIGGTSESRAIAQTLSAAHIPWVATVVTPRAVQLYRGLPGSVQVGPLTPAAVPEFLQTHSIQAIVDASHPFAVEISQLAIATGLPYLRFERPELAIAPPAQVVPNLNSVLQPQHLSQRRVLLTLGVKALPHFRSWHRQATLWARILPTESAKAQAIQAGFPGERLLPLRPPVTLEQERQLWQHLQVDTVITKASGVAGGIAVKQAIARELGTSLIVIARPPIQYPRQTADVDEVRAFCRSIP